MTHRVFLPVSARLFIAFLAALALAAVSTRPALAQEKQSTFEKKADGSTYATFSNGYSIAKDANGKATVTFKKEGYVIVSDGKGGVTVTTPSGHQVAQDKNGNMTITPSGKPAVKVPKLTKAESKEEEPKNTGIYLTASSTIVVSQEGAHAVASSVDPNYRTPPSTKVTLPGDQTITFESDTVDISWKGGASVVQTGGETNGQIQCGFAHLRPNGKISFSKEEKAEEIPKKVADEIPPPAEGQPTLPPGQTFTPKKPEPEKPKTAKTKEEKKRGEEKPKEKTPGPEAFHNGPSRLRGPDTGDLGFVAEAGVGGRGVNIDFNVNSVSHEGGRREGRNGNFTTLFPGESKRYKNGSIVPIGDGEALVTVKNFSQLSPGQTIFGDSTFDSLGKTVHPGDTRDLIATLNSCCERCVPVLYTRSDFTLGGSPFVMVGHRIGSYCWFDVDAGLRYSFLHVDDDSGWGVTGEKIITDKMTILTGFQEKNGQPPNTLIAITNLAEFNNAQTGAFKAPGSTAPIVIQKEIVREVLSKESASVDYHQVAIPFRCTLPPMAMSGHLQAFIETGLTVNFYNTDVTTWTMARRSTRTSENSDTQVTLGVTSEAGLTYRLNKQWSVDVYGGWDYAGPVTIRTGNSSAHVNGSSPIFGVDLNVHF